MANLEFDDSLDLSTAWVTDAPVRKLRPEEFATHAQWLHDQIEDGGVTAAEHNDPAMAASYVAAAARWNQRRDDGLERTAIMAGFGSWEHIDGYAYFYSGKPVAMMAIDKDETAKKSALYIDSLVSHPGARNGGDILIEFAANLSEAMGLGGQIKLTSVRDAVWFYESVGFEAGAGGGWVPCALDPETSDLWEQHDGRWYLTQIWRMRGGHRVLEGIGGPNFRN